MAQSERLSLFDRAMALPQARDVDFFGGRRPPDDAEPEHLRVIADTSLRARLIGAGLAEGLQSPKGPQKIASIIRVYPDGDAPAREPAPTRTGRPVGRPPANPVAPSRGLPTVEAMAALIDRLREVELAVGREFVERVDSRIRDLKNEIAELDGADLERVFRDLGSALDERRALATHARAEAFRRVENDHDFPERVHLRVLARP